VTWDTEKAYATFVLGLVIGAGLFAMWFEWPQAPQSYTVTLKNKCLTDESNWFTMNYSGNGTVKFTIVPPAEAGTPQKGATK